MKKIILVALVWIFSAQYVYGLEHDPGYRSGWDRDQPGGIGDLYNNPWGTAAFCLMDGMNWVNNNPYTAGALVVGAFMTVGLVRARYFRKKQKACDTSPEEKVV